MRNKDLGRTNYGIRICKRFGGFCFFKKLQSEISADEKIISEKEYLKRSGLAFYEKQFGHGGSRKNAGRKLKFEQPLEFQIRVTKDEKDFILYAREHNINYTSLMPLN